MRITLALIVALVIGAAELDANIRWPRATLVGETVDVNLVRDSASVNAIFEFEGGIENAENVVYFPLFAEAGGNPVHVLSVAHFELTIADKLVVGAVPSEAPAGFKEFTKTHPGIFWYATNLDDLAADLGMKNGCRYTVRFNYSQPLINGKFYYLPILIGSDLSTRNWKYQMRVHSISRVPQV